MRCPRPPEDEVLDQAPDLVVGERGDHGGPQPERPAQAARDVVLSAALPGPERAGGADPALPRVEAEHHLTQRDGVVPARPGRADPEDLSGAVRLFVAGHQITCWARATACAVSRRTSSKSPARMRSRGTIHEPPTAATAGMLRYSPRSSGPTPPVGTKVTPPKGAASAAMARAPPEAPAGKNFTVVRPSSIAAWISVAVTAPGSGSTPCSRQRSTTCLLYTSPSPRDRQKSRMPSSA